DGHRVSLLNNWGFPIRPSGRPPAQRRRSVWSAHEWGASTGYLPDGLVQQRYVKSHTTERSLQRQAICLAIQVGFQPAVPPEALPADVCSGSIVFPGPGEKPTPKRSGTVAPSPKLGADSQCITLPAMATKR